MRPSVGVILCIDWVSRFHLLKLPNVVRISRMFKGKKILVVDDEQDLREILSADFESEGALVEEAKNGKEALGKVKSSAFDVVVSDIRMPGGDGVSLARDIKSLDVLKPVVFLITGFSDIKSWEAYELGAEGLVTKPFHLDALRESIDRVMTPVANRWRADLAKEPSLNVVLNQSVSQALEEASLKMGRGGFFVKQASHQFRAGDFLRLKFLDGFIDGIARWVRASDQPGNPSSNHAVLPAGFGLEILHVSPAIMDSLLSANLQVSSKAFIPQA